VFLEGDGTPVQEIRPAAPLPLPVIDLAGDGVPSAAVEARRLARAEAARPFALETGPLLRATLVRLAPRRHVLLVNMHHIVSDGWSIGGAARGLVPLYHTFR